MAISPDEFTALQIKYRRVCSISHDPINLVIRAPSRAEYRAFRAAMHSPTGQADAQEDLIRDLVVWCNGAADPRLAFDELLEEYPALCENRAVSSEISKFTGLEFAAQGKASPAPVRTSAGALPSSQTG